MTQAILSITSLVIGLLIGFSLAHKKNANKSTLPQQTLLPNAPPKDQDWSKNEDPLFEASPKESYFTKTQPHTNTSDPQLLKELRAQSTTITKLLERHQDLEAQLSETSRELNALTFRVETHSESFRPMRQRQDNSVFPSGISPLLPPKQ